MKAEMVNFMFDLAKEARKRAFAPITNIKFGAALLTTPKTKNSGFFTGANIEEWSLVTSRHAEMRAIDEMIFRCGGDAVIKAIIVVGDPESVNLERPVFPCGVCRNYISQFGVDNTIIIAADLEGNKRTTRLQVLLSDRPFKEMKEKEQ